MTRSLILLAVVSSALGAQASSNPSPWEISGNLGAEFRKERGHLIGGARLGAALSKPLGGGERRIELGLGLAQVINHAGPTGNGDDVKENSVELTALGEWPLVAAGKVHLAGAIGPVVSVAF